MTYIDPAGKLLAHLPRLAMLQQGRVPAPINVELDLSNRCSLGCDWCHFGFTHVRGPLTGKREKPAGAVPGGDLMDTTLALSIIDQLAEAGVDSLTFTGGGEPTLHPDFDRVVAYAKGKLALGIYTHGGHIDGWRAQLLKESMTFVYVSLDAADAASYKRDKGVDRYAAVLRNIRRLHEAHGDAVIGVGYLLTKDNWTAAERAVAVVRHSGGDYIQFRPTIHFTQRNPGVPSEDTSWIRAATDELATLVEAYGGFVEVDLDRFREYADWASHGYPTCWWSALQTCITPNGKVWTCVNKREHPDAELGDLSRETFKEVWARRPVAQVNHDCRVMCRGHIPNQTLAEILAPREHQEFV